MAFRFYKFPIPIVHSLSTLHSILLGTRTFSTSDHQSETDVSGLESQLRDEQHGVSQGLQIHDRRRSTFSFELVTFPSIRSQHDALLFLSPEWLGPLL